MLNMDSIIIRYKDNGLVLYDGKDYIESLARVQREKSAWGPTDRRECNSEDKIVRLESRRNTFRSKYSCTICCLQYIEKTIHLH